MFPPTWVEIRFDGAVVIQMVVLNLQVIMDFIKSEPHSHGELYVTASQGGNEMIDVKEEEDSVTVQAVKAEQEVKNCRLYLKILMNLYHISASALMYCIYSYMDK
jgi:hypothetical protein